jgi:hypothetical protein
MTDFVIPSDIVLELLHNEKLGTFFRNLIAEMNALRANRMEPNSAHVKELHALMAENAELRKKIDVLPPTPVVEPAASASAPAPAPASASASAPAPASASASASAPAPAPASAPTPASASASASAPAPAPASAPTPVVEPAAAAAAPEPSPKPSQPSGWVAMAAKNGDVPAESSKPTTPQRVVPSNGKDKKVKLAKVECFLKYLLDLHTKNSSRTADFVKRLAWAFASGDRNNRDSDAETEVGRFESKIIKYNEITFDLFIDGLPKGAKLYNKTDYTLTEAGANHLRAIVNSRNARDIFMKEAFTEYVQGRWGDDNI